MSRTLLCDTNKKVGTRPLHVSKIPPQPRGQQGGVLMVSTPPIWASLCPDLNLPLSEGGRRQPQVAPGEVQRTRSHQVGRAAVPAIFFCTTSESGAAWLAAAHCRSVVIIRVGISTTACTAPLPATPLFKRLTLTSPRTMGGYTSGILNRAGRCIRTLTFILSLAGRGDRAVQTGDIGNRIDRQDG
jgi:hypothetical protein